MKKLLIIILISLPMSLWAQRQSSIDSTLRNFNQFRRAAGLDTVSLSAKLSVGCNNHAQYLVINKNSPQTEGLLGHKEFPGLRGYTKDGEEAGQRSVIHFVNPVAALDGWIKTFYHRIPMLQPNLAQIGIGYAADSSYEVCLLDCISGLSDDTNKIKVVYYPAPLQKNIPVAMGPELPDPTGGYADMCGYPITIFFCNDQVVTNVKVGVTDEQNEPVRCHISTPENPATSFSQWNTICLIPKQALFPKTTYTVSLTCVVDSQKFDKNYSFTTAAE